MKRLVELGKTILIIILLCTLTLLALAAVPTETIRDNPKLSQLLQPLAPLLGMAEAELAYVETALPVLDAAQPVAISVHNSSGRSTAMWSFDALDLSFETFGGLLGQALDTADRFSEVTDGQLRRALTGDSVYFRYGCVLPVQLLATWLGAELEADVPASDSCVISVEGQTVALYLVGKPHMRAITQVSPDALTPLLEQARADGSQFAFECSSHLSDLTLLPGSTVTAPGMTTSNPVDSRHMDQLATILGFNPYSDSRFTDDEGITYFSEANATLEITASGLVTLTNTADDRFRAPSAQTDALVETARQLLETITGGALGDGRLYLSRLETQETAVVCTFDYLAAGIPVRFSSPAATVTFSGQTIRSASVQVLRFRTTGETLYPLPAAQAAAVLPKDGDLALQYQPDGQTLSVGWKG